MSQGNCSSSTAENTCTKANREPRSWARVLAAGVEVCSALQGEQFQQGRSHAKTMTFLIDENTAVDGKLKVGDNADVAYRQQNGNNVAVSVRITPE